MFYLGQRVWLEAKNLTLPYGSVKLAPRCHGPFQITQVISPVAYKLALPLQWTIHPIFHTSLLTPYVETKEHGENYLRPPPDLIGGEEQYKFKAIRSHQHHGRKKQLQYLIKWGGYPKSDNIWEPVTNLQAPHQIKEYHKCHPLNSINRGKVQRGRGQLPTWLLPIKPTPPTYSTTHLPGTSSLLLPRTSMTTPLFHPLHHLLTKSAADATSARISPLSISTPMPPSVTTSTMSTIARCLKYLIPLNTPPSLDQL